jgi:hypothetical protein
VRGQDRDVEGRVVELLRVHLRELEHDAMVALGLDARYAAGGAGEAGRDRLVPGAPEGEGDVARGDRRAVVPAGPRIQLEHQRERIPPGPALRQQRHEPPVARGDQAGPDAGEPEKEMIGDLVVGEGVLRALHQCGHRRGGLLAGDDHDAGGLALGQCERRPGCGRAGENRGEDEACRPGHHGGSGSSDGGGANTM